MKVTKLSAPGKGVSEKSVFRRNTLFSRKQFDRDLFWRFCIIGRSLAVSFQPIAIYAKEQKCSLLGLVPRIRKERMHGKRKQELLKRLWSFRLLTL